MSSWPVVLMLPDLCSTPFPRHFIGSLDLISFSYPSVPHVKHIMTCGILYHCSCNTCFSNCTQSVGNISLVVFGIVVVDDDDDDDDDSNTENTSVASNRMQF